MLPSFESLTDDSDLSPSKSEKNGVFGGIDLLTVSSSGKDGVPGGD
jgi:hypothetical protein